MDDQVVSKAIIIIGLKYSALRKAVESFVVENSINVNINTITNFFLLPTYFNKTKFNRCMKIF